MKNMSETVSSAKPQAEGFLCDIVQFVGTEKATQKTVFAKTMRGILMKATKAIASPDITLIFVCDKASGLSYQRHCSNGEFISPWLPLGVSHEI